MLEEVCEEKESNFASLNYKYKNFKDFVLVFEVSFIT